MFAGSCGGVGAYGGEGDAHVAFSWFLRDSKSELDDKFLMLVYEKAFA